jgi:MFS family permease
MKNAILKALTFHDLNRENLHGVHLNYQETDQNLTYKLFLFSFLQGVGNGVWGFLSIFLLDLGGSGLDIGILSFFPGLISTFMQLAWGRISDRIGRSWRMVSSGFIFTAVFSIPVILSRQPWQVILATAFQAFFSSMAGVAIVVRLSEILRPRRRARFISIYNPLGYAGNIVGSLCTGVVLPLIGYRSAFTAYTIINLGIFALVRYGLQEKDERSYKIAILMRSSLKELNNGLKQFQSDMRRGGFYSRWCMGIAIRGFGIAMFGPVFTVFIVQTLNVSKPQIGALNALAFTIRLVFSPLLGWVIENEGPKKIMLFGVLLASLHPISILPAVGVYHLIPVYVLSGLYWALITSSWFTWQMSLIPAERGLYTGFFNFINGLAWSFGPLFGGFLGELVGIRISAILSSVVVFLGFFTLHKVPNQLEET